MIDALIQAAQTEVDNHSIYARGDQDGVTLGERVSDLEDAVVELAEIITEG